MRNLMEIIKAGSAGWLRSLFHAANKIAVRAAEEPAGLGAKRDSLIARTFLGQSQMIDCHGPPIALD
jgi:hypothetical protein